MKKENNLLEQWAKEKNIQKNNLDLLNSNLRTNKAKLKNKDFATEHRKKLNIYNKWVRNIGDKLVKYRILNRIGS